MIVGILGPGGCGGTFLDWTLHFLSGQGSNIVLQGSNDRSNLSTANLQTIVDNPMRSNTSHGHAKTHPNNQSLDFVVDYFRCQPSENLCSFYYVDSMLETQTSTQYNNIIERFSDIKFLTYNFQESDIDRIFCYQFEKIPHAKDSYLSKCVSTAIWDQRELLSLYYPNSVRGQILNEKINSYNNNFALCFDTVLHHLDDSISKIFDFLQIKISQPKLSVWKDRYRQWQQNNHLDFFKDLDDIIKKILTGQDSCLLKYKLSFAMEVVIAKKLLHEHNLALRSCNVNDLTTSTIQWYHILEENKYHDLQKQ